MSKRYPGGIIRKTPQTPSQTSAQGVWDMASVTQAVKENTWPIAGVPDPISKSLRFRSSASAYLNRTPASAGNRQKWTWSGWVKRGALSSGSYMDLFTALSGANDFTEVRYHFNTNDDTLVFTDVAGGVTYAVYSTNVYRDASAWYHIVCSVDTTQATNTNRVKLYVNGVQVTQNAGGSGYPLQNTNTSVNAAVEHRHGGIATYGRYFDGYMTEVYFIDGQALTPSSFGGTNDQTGVWQPIAYTGTYGTNGFYLPFSNTASTTTLGYDFSGNSNNWTTNNISLTSGTTYDSMVDVPTQWIPYNTAGDTGALFRGNYCVLNPLDTGGTAPSSANLELINGASERGVRSTFAIPTTGLYYAEAVVGTNQSGATDIAFGFVARTTNLSANPSGISNGWLCYATSTTNITRDGTSTLAGAGTALVSGDVLQLAIDLANNKGWLGKNNTWFNGTTGTDGNPSTGANPTFTFSSPPELFVLAHCYSSTINVNFGQQPFSYTPPTGFKALNTFNLPTPTIGATASTQAGKYFNPVLWTGNGSARTITGVGFDPDFVWIKDRSTAYSHVLFDRLRGAGNYLISNGTLAETTDTNYMSAFATDGFSVGTSAVTNGNTEAYVAWNWKANGSGSSNTAGSITSTVSANTTAGFSIVTYTGNATSGATVGHGLGVAPSMIIVKERNNANNWSVYNVNVGNNRIMYLDLTNGQGGTTAGPWNNTTPTSTVFTLGNAVETNRNTGTYVAYCFAQVAGYSAFGSYTGNGSTDGSFVFCGFRPRFVMVKRTDTSGFWSMKDTARDPYNVAGSLLFANASDAEYSNNQLFDLNSNGFKLRGSNNDINASGGTYIYMAFAESPFKFALAR